MCEGQTDMQWESQETQTIFHRKEATRVGEHLQQPLPPARGSIASLHPIKTPLPWLRCRVTGAKMTRAGAGRGGSVSERLKWRWVSKENRSESRTGGAVRVKGAERELELDDKGQSRRERRTREKREETAAHLLLLPLAQPNAHLR